LCLFGSALREDFNPDKSDLDFLVVFDSPDAPGISDRYFSLAEGLERIFHRPVDLVTKQSIKNRIFLDRVIHGYDNVDDAILWDVVSSKLHPFVTQVTTLANEA
jgi:predicted nucleotidyltransferase